MFTFDVVTIGPKIFEQGLKEVLESTSIRKIFFDCRCASDLLFHRYGVRLDGVFDVQAANAIILTWAYTGGYIPAYSYSLPHLARTYLGIQVKSVLVKGLACQIDNLVVWLSCLTNSFKKLPEPIDG